MFPFTTLALRARRALARRAVRRLAVALLALATGAVVTSLVASAEASRRAWGETRPVAVATRRLAAGEVLTPSSAEVRDLPVALTPERALPEVPAGATVRQPIAAGEALVPERLAPDGLTGVAALVPEGSRAVAVPAGPVATPPLTIGDRVDLLVVVPATGAAGGEATAASAFEPAFPLVEGALVVAVDDSSTSVAVPRDDASRVAYALAQGTVVLALAGP